MVFEPLVLVGQELGEFHEVAIFQKLFQFILSVRGYFRFAAQLAKNFSRGAFERRRLEGLFQIGADDVGDAAVKFFDFPALQPARLDARTAEALCAVNAGLSEEQPAGVLRSEPSGLGAERLAIWTLGGIGMSGQNCAGRRRGIAKPAATLGKTAGEELGG